MQNKEKNQKVLLLFCSFLSFEYMQNFELRKGQYVDTLVEKFCSEHTAGERVCSRQNII